MASMKLTNINKYYENTQVLHNLNLEIKDGEFVVLIGSSGCGKSTFLRMICGLEEIDDGELYIDGQLTTNMRPQQRGMSMVFQSYALYPHLSVFENIAYGLRIQKLPKAEIDTKVKQVAELLNIREYLNRLPKNLSGGQRQRVAMGRAIVREPKFFLFDEPLSNLDAKLRVVMRKEIKLLQKKLGITTVYVTHDQIEAMTMGDKIVLLDAGRIIQVGTPEELYDSPNSVFTATFLGSPQINLLKGKVATHNGVTTFRTNDGLSFTINPPLKDLDDQEYLLGIRPRDFSADNSQNGYLVKPTLIEYTGGENMIYGNMGENEVTVTFSRKEKFDKQLPLYVKHDQNRALLFEAQSGKAVV